MPRLRTKHLPHRVDTVILTAEGPEGEAWSEPDADRPAYVEQKTRLVIDRRSTSATVNTEVAASTFVVMLTDDEVLPRSQVTVWKGTPRERTSEVINSSFFSYDKRTPNHVELYLE